MVELKVAHANSTCATLLEDLLNSPPRRLPTTLWKGGTRVNVLQFAGGVVWVAIAMCARCGVGRHCNVRATSAPIATYPWCCFRADTGRIGAVLRGTGPVDQQQVNVCGVQRGQDGVPLLHSVVKTQRHRRAHFGRDENLFLQRKAAKKVGQDRA